MSIALLEIAIEGHLIITDNEKDTLAFVTDCFKHAIGQPKGKLPCTTSAPPALDSGQEGTVAV
jgi:hypothetical protein